LEQVDVCNEPVLKFSPTPRVIGPSLITLPDEKCCGIDADLCRRLFEVEATDHPGVSDCFAMGGWRRERAVAQEFNDACDGARTGGVVRVALPVPHRCRGDAKEMRDVALEESEIKSSCTNVIAEGLEVFGIRQRPRKRQFVRPLAKSQ